VVTSTSTNLNIRIDKEIKHQAEELLDEMGLNLSTAVNIFIRQLVRDGSIPFKITTKREDLSQYNLPFIRGKLAEAETENNDPSVKRIGVDEVMRKYQEKYGYEI